jgi:hypothetical protein
MYKVRHNPAALFEASGANAGNRRPAIALFHGGRHSTGREFPQSLLPETGNGVMGSDGFTWMYYAQTVEVTGADLKKLRGYLPPLRNA